MTAPTDPATSALVALKNAAVDVERLAERLAKGDIEIEALQAVVRLFLVDNDEHINYARTVHGELKVWVNGEKNYLSPSAAEAAVRAVDNGRSGDPR